MGVRGNGLRSVPVFNSFVRRVAPQRALAHLPAFIRPVFRIRLTFFEVREDRFRSQTVSRLVPMRIALDVKGFFFSGVAENGEEVDYVQSCGSQRV